MEEQIVKEELKEEAGLHIKDEKSSIIDNAPHIEKSDEKMKDEIKYFQCASCIFKEKYEYFGRNPPQTKNYMLSEDAYVIEDPFHPPKQGRIITLGAHCITCRKSVCKDVNCSMYFDGTYCIECAKNSMKSFPSSVQEKLNRIIS